MQRRSTLELPVVYAGGVDATELKMVRALRHLLLATAAALMYSLCDSLLYLSSANKDGTSAFD